MATRDAAAAAEILTSHAETIPLVPHRAAATSAGRREGLVVDDSKRDSDSRSSTIHGHTGLRVGDAKSRDCSRWTEENTTRALEGRPYEEYLGLKFYLEYPLPRIRRACASSKKRFIDHEFPTYPEASVAVMQGKKEILVRPGIITPSNCRDFVEKGGKRAKRIPHFVSKAESQWDWVRASSMHDDGEATRSIFSSCDSIDPRNVLQGQVGNCGFCSGFASLAAEWPERLRSAFGPDSEECIRNCGAYSLRLYPRGRRRFLLLDDYLLSLRDNDVSYRSPSMHSSDERDLWIRLLEKAFVKLQGSYASLDGYYKYNSLYRHPARAMQILTNAPVALELHYGGGNNNGSIPQRDMHDVYETLLATQGVCARVAHCRRTVDGLRSNHGYSLLWIGEAKGLRLVCLRNPHGRGCYTGHDWGTDSSLWKGEEDLVEKNDCFAKCAVTGKVTWRQRGPRPHDTDMGADDGIFFVGFRTFVECFPVTTLVGPIRPACNNKESNADEEDGAFWDVPDCVHKVKRNHSCVREVMTMALGHVD